MPFDELPQDRQLDAKRSMRSEVRQVIKSLANQMLCDQFSSVEVMMMEVMKLGAQQVLPRGEEGTKQGSASVLHTTVTRRQGGIKFQLGDDSCLRLNTMVREVDEDSVEMAEQPLDVDLHLDLLIVDLLIVHDNLSTRTGVLMEGVILGVLVNFLLLVHPGLRTRTGRQSCSSLGTQVFFLRQGDLKV